MNVNAISGWDICLRIIVSVAAILFVLGGRALFEPTMTFETYFDESVAELDIGSPVCFEAYRWAR